MAEPLAQVAKAIYEGTFQMEDIGEDDSIYHYDEEAQNALEAAKPWKEDQFYFKKVRISAVALLKIAMHAHSGATGRKAGQQISGASGLAGNAGTQGMTVEPDEEEDGGEKKRFEVMGYLQGKVMDDGTFVIMDSIQVDAAFSEVSVEMDENATNQLLAHNTLSRGGSLTGTEVGRPDLGKWEVPPNPVNRPEKPVGWYHTHPGLTLFFSATDVINQRGMQMYGDPYIAMVFEPVQMMELGRCRIGAFRVLPAGYKGKMHDDKAFEKQSAWSADPGLYAPIPEVDLRAGDQQYYRLEVSVFKSKLDNAIISKLFNDGWGHALASCTGTDEHIKLVQLQDLADRAEEVDEELQSGRMGRGLMGGMGGAGGSDSPGKGATKMQKLSADAIMASQIQVKDMMKDVLRTVMFSR